MNCSRFCSFGLYAIWVALGYWAAQKSLFFLSGIDLSTADLYPVIFPIMASFFLSVFEWKEKSKKRKWFWPLILSLVCLGGAILSLQGLWLNFDTIFFVPFVTLFGLFAIFSLFVFYPYQFLEKHLKLIAFISVFYFGGLVVFLTAQYNWLFVVKIILNILATVFGYLSLPIVAVPEIGMVGMETFNVGIGLPCIGITSFLLFWSFYGGYGVTEWGRNRLNIAHFIIVFVLGLTSLFLLNSARIGALVFIGARYSPEFAINMFHNFAGVALFLIFTIPYFLLTRWWVQKR